MGFVGNGNKAQKLCIALRALPYFSFDEKTKQNKIKTKKKHLIRFMPCLLLHHCFDYLVCEQEMASVMNDTVSVTLNHFFQQTTESYISILEPRY